ncbi:MAG: tRNA (N(6)-L-threonylcarbamoyladenosine(37)-C(2))-methylthiotransferase MtaB [Dehalococcoidia bacterium]
MRTVAILTLGCKLNQADSQALARELGARGCRVTERPEEADAVIVNSCTVTHVADRKARHLVRLSRRLAPEAIVALTGCYADSGGSRLVQLTGADLVLGNRYKPTLVRRLLALWGEDGQDGCYEPLPAEPALRTRAFVKIQEGCNDVCAFCIVPRVRGREESVPIAQVVAQARAHGDEGVREVVLTGTQLGNYGRDMGLADGLRRLLAALLAETRIPRIRVSSLQAQNLSPELLGLWQDPRLCRHLHIPLQSGSDRVLARMRRRYDAALYRRAVALAREHIGDVAITTDVIVGFPGETDEEFQETYRLCQEVGFAAIHVFPYSRRPGTAANLMADHVAAPVKRDRTGRLLALAQEASTAFRRRFWGQTVAVLWEGETGGGCCWQGLTDNYIRVYTRNADDLRNRLLLTRLGDLVEDGVWGAGGLGEGWA